jgi:hypothetical protein
METECKFYCQGIRNRFETSAGERWVNNLALFLQISSAVQILNYHLAQNESSCTANFLLIFLGIGSMHKQV